MHRSTQRWVATLAVAALIGGGSAVLGPAQAGAAISPAEVRIGDLSIPEGDGTANTKATMSVVLSGPASSSVCVEFTIGSPATATGAINTSVHDASHDFVIKHGFRRIPTGKSLVTVPVSVLGDDVVEANETFSVHLDSVRAPASTKCLSTDPVSSDRVARPTGTITIIDDDSFGPQTLTVGAAAIPERDDTITSTASVPMALSAPSPATGLCVEWGTPPTQPDTASSMSDYRGRVRGFAKIAAGKTVAKASVKVTGDNSTEGHEEFSVVVARVTLPNGAGKCADGNVDAGVNVVGSPAKVKILDDDGPFAPEGFTVSFQPPDTIVLSWSPPSFEGGAPVSGYFVQQWVEGVGTIPIVTTTELSASHACGAGNTCAYYVHALNSHGYGNFVFTGPVDCC